MEETLQIFKLKILKGFSKGYEEEEDSHWDVGGRDIKWVRLKKYTSLLASI